MAERRDLAQLVKVLLGLVRRRMRTGRKGDNGHGHFSCGAEKLLLRSRDCNAQIAIRNKLNGGKTIKLRAPGKGLGENTAFAVTTARVA
jgi:hypothetical protein